MLNIIGQRKISYIVSTVLMIASVTVVIVWGVKPGIDFRGGTLVEVRFSDAVDVSKETVTEKISQTGVEGISIQPSQENRMIVRYADADDDVNEQVLGKIRELDENLEVLRTDFIGGAVSSELRTKAVNAVIVAVIAIALYIAWAFRKVSQMVSSWQYGIGAVIALAHDIIITVGIFAVLGKFCGIEVGIPFVAALLTILGYSVNDTIVVYDRIRENILKARSGKFEEIVNQSINETIARSINTSLTVVIVLIAVIFFGGKALWSFALALLIGVVFGTYSSIFVASALLVTYDQYRKKAIAKKA
ncbi:MAG: protein translocase subunit SecF [Candidatus Moranbacteria bacterium]|nr:protein translocase subunit SecF [Candidatus Moranbacteria bacterium]